MEFSKRHLSSETTGVFLGRNNPEYDSTPASQNGSHPRDSTTIASNCEQVTDMLSNLELVEICPAMSTLNVPPSAISIDEEMCRTCMRIYDRRIRPVRFGNKGGEHGIFLAALPHTSFESSCKLCKFFCEMKMEPQESGPHSLYAFPGFRFFYESTSIEAHRQKLNVYRPPEEIPLYAIISGKKRRLTTSEITRIYPRQNFFVINQTPKSVDESSTRPTKQSSISGRQLDLNRIDYGIIRQWMAECLSENACGPHDGTLPTSMVLYLIDCKTREIIRWDSTKKANYVALSYVWGSSVPHIKENTHLKSLPIICPNTIEDAINVTNNLGIPFLWVDCFCISSDPSIKHQQIARMDLVYKHSRLTIIAASSKGADGGLPGVSSTKRHHQPRLQLANGCLLSIFSDLDSILNDSIYSKRGWTYQERFFSHRQLIFTHEQMYFQCSQQISRESVYHSGSHNRRTRSRPCHQLQDKYLKRTNIYGYGVFAPSGLAYWNLSENTCKTQSLNSFETHVSQYTRRKLTYEMDSLTAVQSILDRFLQEKYPIEHIHGIPFFPRGTIYRRRSLHSIHYYYYGIECGLLWTHGPSLRPIKRRAAFPSWSWTGWEGGVQWLSTNSETNGLSVLKNCEVSYMDDKDELHPVVEWHRGLKITYPSRLWISAKCIRFEVIRAGDAFYLGQQKEIINFYSREGKLNFQVHLTIAEEEVRISSCFSCWGFSGFIGDPNLRLLLVYKPQYNKKIGLCSTEIDPLSPGELERLGVASVPTEWHDEQELHPCTFWLV